MRRLFLIVVPFFLSGCVLDRHEAPPTLQASPYSGNISLIDLSGLDSESKIASEAKVRAQFSRKTELPNENLSSRFKHAFLPIPQRGVQCQVISRAISQKTLSKEKPFSVGELSLGTLVSGQAISVPEVELGHYEKALSPHFAPGIYFMQARGNEVVGGFRVEFAMPEEIRGITINDHGLEEGPAIFQKSEPTLLEVDPPTAPNDMNILELILITQNEEEERALVCAVYENELEMVNGKQKLEVPSAQLSGLFATPQAVMEILRINVISGIVPNGPSLRIEGVRAWVWPSWVAE